MGAPETDVRPEVADAYRRMQDGEITREQYDTVVLGTISPYDFVPVPATYQEMFDALGGDKKSKVNVPIEDGTEVGLRLDIPAYTDAGVWVPTIHGMFGKDSKGKILRTSHRATASILNADFTQNKQDAPQRVMEGKVPGLLEYSVSNCSPLGRTLFVAFLANTNGPTCITSSAKVTGSPVFLS